jgi:hypothetical protein
MSYREREPSNLKEMGETKYRERIHKDSKISAERKNLPYTFGVEKKCKPENILVECSGCSKSLFVSEDALISVCGTCKTLNRIK